MKTPLVKRLLKDLFPDIYYNKLRVLWKKNYQKKSKKAELGRIILATAEIENVVTHTRIKDLSTEHAKDITSELMYLVREEFLEKHGKHVGLSM